MQTGYLSIEIRFDRPGLLRLVLSDRCPAIPEGRADGLQRVHYIARFDDGEAALMHAHQLLRRQLVDVDSGVQADTLARVKAIDGVLNARAL